MVMIHREDPWTVSDPVSQAPPELCGMPFSDCAVTDLIACW